MTVIIFEGMIGAGKTTYARALAQALGSTFHPESVDDNPLLEDYYADRQRYSFAMQIYFLNKRFRDIKAAYRNRNDVLDRSIYCDALFTRLNYQDGNMSRGEYEIYLDLLDNMLEELEGQPSKQPDLMIYLDCSLDHCLDNIRARGRDYEQVDQHPDLLPYYQRLYQAYQDWYAHYDLSPKMAIDCENYDICHEEDWQEVKAAILEQLEAARKDQVEVEP